MGRSICVVVSWCFGRRFVAAGAEAGRISDAVTAAAMDLGLSANIVSTGGSGGIMRIAPPLTVTEEEIDLGVALLDAAIRQAMA